MFFKKSKLDKLNQKIIIYQLSNVPKMACSKMHLQILWNVTFPQHPLPMRSVWCHNRNGNFPTARMNAWKTRLTLRHDIHATVINHFSRVGNSATSKSNSVRRLTGGSLCPELPPPTFNNRMPTVVPARGTWVHHGHTHWTSWRLTGHGQHG